MTGSKYLLTYGQTNILIDCGLFQGLKSLRLKNWDGFPIDASKIDQKIHEVWKHHPNYIRIESTADYVDKVNAQRK